MTFFPAFSDQYCRKKHHFLSVRFFILYNYTSVRKIGLITEVWRLLQKCDNYYKSVAAAEYDENMTFTLQLRYVSTLESLLLKYDENVSFTLQLRYVSSICQRVLTYYKSVTVSLHFRCAVSTRLDRVLIDMMISTLPALLLNIKFMLKISPPWVNFSLNFRAWELG